MSDLQNLINQLDALNVLDDERVAAAFRAVPRAVFLPNTPPERANADVPVYTSKDQRGEFIGGSDQPSQLARVLTNAQLEPGQNVLEIGTGSGYSAALLQHIVGERGNVTTIELDREFAESASDALQRARAARVNVVNADGAGGYSPRASYDRIISTVGMWDIPEAWVKQLRPGGLIIAPIYLDGLQVVCVLQPDRTEGTLYSDCNRTASFVRMRGPQGPPAQYLHLGGGSALRLYSNNAYKLDGASLHMLLSMDAERCHLGAAPRLFDYWYGLIPFAMLNVPANHEFVCYTVEGDKMVYGLGGDGFGLVARGGACFVCAEELGDTHCFGGADAFLSVVDLYSQWEASQKPRIEQMRVRLFPNSDGPLPTPERGRLFRRPTHDVHAWLDPVEAKEDTSSVSP